MNDDLFFPKISTFFETKNDLYFDVLQKKIRNLLQKAFTGSFLEAKDRLLQKFHAQLPFISWTEANCAPCNISFYLCCPYRQNAYGFFYEMVSRWLVPGKKLNALLQFAVDFSLPDLSNQIYIGGEVILRIEHARDLAILQKNLLVMEQEIRLGLQSFYQASRILEIKGVASDEKTALIQENITSLIKHRPQDFDYDIFPQLQHFLVICADDFKAMRNYRHLSRIICVHYLFRKTLQLSHDTFPDRRYVNVKIIQDYIKDNSFKTKKIVGIILGVSFLKENEILEEKHVLNAIKTLIPQAQCIEGSFLANHHRKDPIVLLYIEIEKANGFSLEEIKILKNQLHNEIKNRIEKKLNTLFMPQNEEEIMRHILTLSNELRYMRDLPQTIISFEKQTEESLEFLITIVRIVKETNDDFLKKIPKLFEGVKFTIDRTKNVGFIRKKYKKEAIVIKAKIKKSHYLRQDHSVDFYKARQHLVYCLNRIVGEFRDYNGGIISKEAELLTQLRALLGKITNEQEFVLENYFYSFSPAITRSFLDASILKNLFLLLLESPFQFQQSPHSFLYRINKENECLYLMLAAKDPTLKEIVLEALQKLELATFQLATCSMHYQGLDCLGVIFRPNDQSQQLIFIKTIEKLLDNWSERAQLVFYN